MKTRKHKSMTPKEFKQIKALLDADIPVNKVRKVFDRSYATVSEIQRATTFSEYKIRTRERWTRNMEIRNSKKETQVGEPNASLPKSNGLKQELQEIKSVLVSIDTVLKTKSPRSFKMF